MKFTGNKETDKIILQNLDDDSLTKFCQINKYAKLVCNDEFFWLNRIIIRSSKDVLMGKKEFQTYKDYYISGKYKVYELCKNLSNKVQSQLVIDTLYNSVTGYINVYSNNIMDFLILKILLSYVKKHPSPVLTQLDVEEMLNEKYTKIQTWNTLAISENINIFNDTDFKTFHKVIDMNSSKIKNYFKSFKLSILDKRFIEYIHLGFRNKKIPLDMTWNKLCSLSYVMNFKI